MNRSVTIRTAGALSLLAVVSLVAACVPVSGDAGSVSSRPPTEPGSSPTVPASPSPATPSPSATSPGSPTAAPTTAPTATTAAAELMPLTVYFFMADAEGNPKLVPVERRVPQTVAVARAAVGELLRGPSAEEAEFRTPISTTIPADTVLLDIAINDGIATVDLSREFESGGGSASMTGRLAQVVYTLTQFPTVQSVSFRLDGRPVEVFSGEGIVLDGPSTREHYTEQLPEIFADRPAFGSTPSNPVRITGLTRVFEATLMAGLYEEDGDEITSQVVTATCGTGCWGSFDVSLPYDVDERQTGSVVVWNNSARDGSPENVRAHPIVLLP